MASRGLRLWKRAFRPLVMGAVGLAVLSLGAVAAAGLPKPHVDLAVTRVTVAQGAAAITVAETTRNTGDVLVPSSVTGIYLSAHRTHGSAHVRVGRITVPVLLPQHEKRQIVSLTMPMLTSAATHFAGSERLYVVACADDLHRVVEWRETNNCAVSASGIDLSLGRRTPPPTAPPVAADTQPPSAPGTLTAALAGASEIDLSWGAAGDNVGVTGYQVFRCQGAGCTGFSLLAQPAGTATGYKDTGLSAGTTFSYEVRALDAAGNLGPFSNQSSATTQSSSAPTQPSPDTQPPSTPAGLVTSGVGPTSLTLSWNASSDNVGVTGYRLYVGAGQVGTSLTTHYLYSGLACDTSPTIGVAAVDAAGNVSGIASVVAHTAACPDTQPPSAPGTLAASAVGASEIDLTWGAAGDNVGVSGYQVFRCQGVGCTDFSLLAQAAGMATGYADTGLSASTGYSYQVRAVDAAGNRGPFSNTAGATTGPGVISVGPNGRYLVDQSGNPFLMVGDSPQAMIGNLTLADAEYFFADRRAHGFNTVWINLLCTSYTACNADGTTYDGIAPFTSGTSPSNYDLSTPNEAYFARADQIIRLAAQYGLTVLLDPAETGGWLDALQSNGVQKDYAYGQFLGERYKDFPNIIWMSGNDYQDFGPTNDPYVTAVAEGIKDVDTRHLQTVELSYPTSGSLDDSAWAPIIGLNASYTYNPAYEQVLTDYDRPNFLPTFLVEGTYEFEQNSPSIPYGNPLNLRHQEYWSILSGATGQLYGNHYTWQFICNQRDDAGNCIDGWKSELDTPGAVQLGYLTALFESRAWYDLVPDQSHTLVTDGYGTYGDDDYVTAARTPDGTLAMAYVPTASTITVDLSTMSGPVTARWYDPAAGTFTDIPGSPFANDDTRQFTTPGDNADGPGNEDWVLVLEVPS